MDASARLIISNALPCPSHSKKHKSEKLDVVHLTFYTAPVSMACLLPFVCLFEVRRMVYCIAKTCSCVAPSQTLENSPNPARQPLHTHPRNLTAGGLPNILGRTCNSCGFHHWNHFRSCSGLQCGEELLCLASGCKGQAMRMAAKLPLLSSSPAVRNCRMCQCCIPKADPQSNDQAHQCCYDDRPRRSQNNWAPSALGMASR